MPRIPLRATLTLLASLLVLEGALEREARATGAVFEAESSSALVTEHRVAIAITPTATTIWDQIDFAGDPDEFAWVLPIRGAVTVGVGHDDFLQALDRETSPEIRAPARRCSRAADGCGGSGAAGCGASDESASEFPFDTGYQEDAGIWVTAREVAGPYAAVQVHGTDAGAIVGWLRKYAYAVPTTIEPILSSYVASGYDFLAVRLRAGRGIRAMAPIRVSAKGSSAALPLRMLAASGSSSVVLKLFVISDARYRAKSHPSFLVEPGTLTWDFEAGRSDYVEARARAAAAFAGVSFAIESSVDLPRTVLPELSSPPLPGADAGAAGETDASTDAETDGEPDAAPEYDAGAPPGFAEDTSDLEIAYGTYGVRRVTRLRAEIAVSSLDGDLELERDDASPGTLPRAIEVERSIGAPVCPGTASIARTGARTGANTNDDDGPRGGARIAAGIVLAAIAGVLARRASRR